MNIETRTLEYVEETGLQAAVPNLDNRLIGELPQVRRELLAVANTFKELAKYVECVEVATHHRLVGRIELANQIEAEADKVYSALPDWAKW